MASLRPPHQVRLALAEALVVVCVIGAFVAYVAPTLDRPLLEKHAWRQTQTAYAARIFHEEGIDLLHPQVPVFGAPYDLPFELPAFQAAASLLMDAGVEEDLAMRLTGLSCFLATALLLYGLVRRLLGPVGAVASLVAFVMTPLALVWARASMIEYLATAGAVGFAWALISWREQRRPTAALLALLAGLVGMLVKPTTAVFWVLPALAYRPATEGPPTGRRVHAVTAALVLVPLAAALLWTQHADSVKAASRTTAFLTSSNLQEWNFGTVSQRLDPDTWAVIFKRLGPTVIGLYGAFLVVAVLATIREPQRRFWLAMWAAAVAPFLVFTNLYVRHDYYLAAVTPAFAALAGLGAAFVASRVPRGRVAAAAGVLALLLVAYGSLELGRGYWLRIHGSEDDPQVLPLAAEARALTRPAEPIAVIGLEWSPAVPYYARRRAHMIIGENEPFAYDLVRADGYGYLLVGDPWTADLTPFARWRWLGSLGPHSYALADAPDRLRGARFLATDELPRSASPIRRNVRIPCGRRSRVPTGARGTWILPLVVDPKTRVTVAEDLAPLPLRRALYVAPPLARGGALTLRCVGSPSVAVDVLGGLGPDAG